MSMTMLPLLLLGLLSTIGVHGQLEACGDDAVSMGYKSVAALNEAAAASTGIFTICPNSVLSDEILRPMIDGSVFICSSCTLTTGVAIDADNVRLSIVGVTFRDFTDVAISGSAGSSTTLELRQVVFQDFNSSIVVSQTNLMRQPFRLEVSGAEVKNAFGGVLFSNAGAELSIEDLSVADSTLVSVVSTANSLLSEGSSFLRRVLVTRSNVEDVFLTMGSADIDAKDINVNSMRGVNNVFSIANQGTGARIHDLVVADNTMQSRWTVINAMEQSEVMVENVSVFNSTSLRHVFSAATRSSLTVDRAEIADLMGGRIISPQDVSSIVFSNSESIMSVDRLGVDSISMFTSVFFGNAGSTVTVMRSCAQTGSVQAAVYVSEETSITSNDNYISDDFGSAVCGTGDSRMVQEDPGSGCFQQDRQDCSFGCEPFFTGVSCRADETDAPTSSPTSSPTAVTPSPSVNILQVTGAPNAAGNMTLVPTIESGGNVTLVPTMESDGNMTLVPTMKSSLVNGTERVKPNRIDIYGDDTLVIEQSIDYPSQTVSVTATSVGDGWVGFAFSDSPSMVSSNPVLPTIAIIGSPADGTVRKYLLGGRTMDLVTPLPPNRQSLTNTSITQQNGSTVLTFTKPLEELGEKTVSLSGENGFIFAVGTTQDLAYHGAIRGYSSAVIPVIGAPILTAPSGLPTSEPTKAPSGTDKPTFAPVTPMPTPSAPFTRPPTFAPSRALTKTPTEFLLTRNPTHVPTSALIEATLRPAVAADETQAPVSQASPPSTPRPTHSPLFNRFTPTFLPIPTDAPVRYMPIYRHRDDDDDDYSYHGDDYDDDDDDKKCDCSETGEKKGKGNSSEKSSEGKEKGKGKKKSGKGKGKKSKRCKCRKGEKRHMYRYNHQANHAVHRAGEERV